MGQLLITETEKRDYLRFAFYARKQYRDNWIQRIETELQDQTLNEKAINKKMIGLEVWKNLHPVIERYPDEIIDTWKELPLNELWKTIKADRDLADVLLNGVWRLKLNIEEAREFQCLEKLDAEMVKKETENIAHGFVAGKDARDVKAWVILHELENSLQSMFRMAVDQQQAAAPAADRKQKERKGRQGRLFKFIGEMKPEHRIVFLTNNSGCKDHDILFETVWFPRYNTLYPKEAIKDIKAFKAAVASAKKGYKKEYPDWRDSE